MDQTDVHYSLDARDFDRAARSIPCQQACPALTNIPGYIRNVYEQQYGRAYELNRRVNILPGVLGRICSRPCESACRHGEPGNGRSVGICWLKRACADLKPVSHRIFEGLYTPTGKRVAVIGSGPAGLAAAHDLAVLGHEVVVYESMDKPGGMMMYGIPEFRLPRDLLMMEINNVLRLGILLKTGVSVGTDISLDTLQKDFDAVVTATGCVMPRQLNIPGEDLDRVHSGLDFMKAVNNGDKPFVGDRVVVIGAGFTAVDCARSARRLGAAEVGLYIRRTVEDMRIDASEKHEAALEKISVHSLVQPSAILGRNGQVTGVVFVRTRMVKNGNRRSPVPIADSEFTVPADSVIAALGQEPAPKAVSGDLARLDKEGHTTGLSGVFAAGDVATGSSDVISAIAGGRKCALKVDEALTGTRRKQWVVSLEPHGTTDRPRAFDFIDRVDMNTLDPEERFESVTREVETGYRPEQAVEEAGRCYLCYLRYDIDPTACIYCSACLDAAPRDCIKMIRGLPVLADGTYGPYEETRQWKNIAAIAIDHSVCIRCGQCLAACPMDCIHVTRTEHIEIDI